MTYYDTWDYKTNLLNGSASQIPAGLPITGGAGNYSVNSPTTGITGLAAASTVQRLDVDLQWKF